MQIIIAIKNHEKHLGTIPCFMLAGVLFAILFAGDVCGDYRKDFEFFVVTIMVFPIGENRKKSYQSKLCKVSPTS